MPQNNLRVHKFFYSDKPILEYNPRVWEFLNYGRHVFYLYLLGIKQIHEDIAQVYIRFHRYKK
jgi:hypothetical protein